MDISASLAPDSKQLDAIELVSGPRIFQVEKVSKGDVEQPVQIHLVDFPRPWRPGKSMRRVLAACWGTDASQWAGRRVELFFDPEVTFGKEKPGGTRISRLSHIDAVKKIPLLVSRGKSATYVVQPLPDDAPATTPELTDAMIACATDVDQLGQWWKQHPDRRKDIEARVAEIKAADDDTPTPPAEDDQ